jgi:hypothetical protein
VALEVVHETVKKPIDRILVVQLPCLMLVKVQHRSIV